MAFHTLYPHCRPQQPARWTNRLLASLAALLLLLPAFPAHAYAPTPATAPAATGAAAKPVTAPTATDSAPIAFDQLGAAADQQSATAAHNLRATATGAELAAVFQDVAGSLGADGLWLYSTADDTPARTPFRIMATGLGRGIAVAQPLAATGTVQVRGEQAQWVRPSIIEEYSVSTDGVRQDFVLLERPAGAAQLRLDLTVTGATVSARKAGDGLTLYLADANRALAYSRLHVTDATGRTLAAHMQASAPNRLSILVDDQDARWPLRIDPTVADADWVSMSVLAGTNDAVRALAVSGTTLYIGGDFKVISDVRANRIAQWDGNAWSPLSSGMDNSVFTLAVISTTLYAGGDFRTAGGVDAIGIAQWDGAAWAPLGTGDNNGVRQDGGGGGSVRALAVSGATLYVGGNFASAGGAGANSIARWDGNAWAPLGTDSVNGVTNGDSSGIVNALAMSGTTLYVGGAFQQAGGVAVNSIAQWDGSAWGSLGAGDNNGVRYEWGSNGIVYALAVSGATLYAGGYFHQAGGAGANSIAQWDGNAWTPLGNGVSGTVIALAVSGATLYVGGNFTQAGEESANSIAQWNGSAWALLGTGDNNGVSKDDKIFNSDVVRALAVVGATLYVGGEFSGAGEVNAYGIARWDGNAWSALGAGTGLNGEVKALAVVGATLYVGGEFTQAGGVRVNSIAQWDGSAWSPLGNGLRRRVGSGVVYALAVSGSTLYVGGDFYQAGEERVNGIAQWDGSAWSPLGNGLMNESTTGQVFALAVSGTTLYVGGNFYQAGEGRADSIAQWDGSAWSPLGDGVNGGDVYALAVSGTTLYVGGDFYQAGGVDADSIAQWDGSAWSPLGDGVNGTVKALAVSGTTLYVGGAFNQAGGVDANGIAQWDGSAWSALGNGIDTYVNALAVSGTTLYVGGRFAGAGGERANSIAQWDGNAWTALGSGVQAKGGNIGQVSLLAMIGATLYVGGEFVNAGAAIAFNLAKVTFGPQAVVTIVLDTQPNLATNLAFKGDFGPFILDDPATNDGDAYSNRKTFSVLPGSYTVSRNAATGWFVTAIACTPAGGATINLAQRQAALTLADGDNVTCTFTVERAVTIRARTFNDRVRTGTNLGKRNAGDPWLNGWTIRAATAPTATAITNVTEPTAAGLAEAVFQYLRPGAYTVCAVLPNNTWTPTTPGVTDPAYGNLPCKPVTLAPGKSAILLFGAYQPTVVASEAFTPEDEPITDADSITDRPYDPAEEETLSDGLPRLFLPLVRR